MLDKTPQAAFFTPEVQQMVDEFFTLQCRYTAALREVQTKLEILDDEYHTCHRRNPIHHIESRIKTIASIMEKLSRKQFPVNMASALENIRDIAGIRVICSYVEDVYTISRLLTSQDDVKVLAVRDYILTPKENGYRSLHLILEIPVYLQEGRIGVPVEVQLRTIAMDFWASLEHSMRYKGAGEVPDDISRELLDVSQDVAALDRRMQALHDRIQRISDQPSG